MPHLYIQMHGLHHLYSSTDEALASFPSIVGKAELEYK